MSDPNQPPRPEGSGEGPGGDSGDAPAPPPPSGYEPPPAPPPSGDDPGGGAAGYGGYGGAGASGGSGGYGAPPPGGPPGQPQPAGYSPTDALSFGWRHFTARPATLLVPVLVIGVAIAIVSLIVNLLVGAVGSGSSFGAALVAAAVSSAIVSLIAQLLIAGLYKGGASVADGRGFSFGDLFEGWDKAQVLIAAVIIAVLTLIGTVLCYLPALIVGYFTQFTLLFVVDKHLSAVDAIKASFRLCMDNLGQTILWYLLAVLCLIVGAILCLVGLLVAAPVVLVGLAYTFRTLQGEPVADTAPRTA
jgi:uncharacterized membrane protein